MSIPDIEIKYQETTGDNLADCKNGGREFMLYFDIPANQSRIEVTINDDRLISVLGPCFEWGEGFAEIIDGMIQTRDEIRVQDARALQALIQRDYIDAQYLNLGVAPLFRNQPVVITMTGSRRNDAAAADAELTRLMGFQPDYDGYTWHHKEDIRKEGGRWRCNMYLVESGYHRRHPHKGGVYVYEFQTGRKYS